MNYPLDAGISCDRTLLAYMALPCLVLMLISGLAIGCASFAKREVLARKAEWKREHMQKPPLPDSVWREWIKTDGPIGVGATLVLTALIAEQKRRARKGRNSDTSKGR